MKYFTRASFSFKRGLRVLPSEHAECGASGGCFRAVRHPDAMITVMKKHAGRNDQVVDYDFHLQRNYLFAHFLLNFSSIDKLVHLTVFK